MQTLINNKKKKNMTQHIGDLPIVDMESAKSDVNGWKEKVYFLLLFIGKYKKIPNHNSKTYKPY